MTPPLKHPWCGPRRALLLLLLPVLVGAATKSNKVPSADALFSGSEVLQFKIEANEEAIATLSQYQWQMGQQPERKPVQVTVREGENVYRHVALHLKGAAGSFRPVEDKPAMTLNFDRFAVGQHFHGLTKLSLNNSVQDPTFVSEQLCRELFLKAGVPVPRATHAWVELNGRDLGLYVLTEGWDRDFLRRHFKNAKGNLYDGGFLKDITDELSTNAGNGKDQSDRIALVEAAREANLTNRLERLEKALDVDRFLTFVALDVLLWDWDGYALNRNNWRLYKNPDTGRMVFMPHGLDQMFWNPKGSILPPMQGLVAKAALQLPELRQRYFDRLKDLRATVFQPQAMTSRVHAIAAKFVPQLKKKHPSVAQEHQRALKDYCDAIMRRGQSVDEQLANPIEPAKFDLTGYARLSGWDSKTDFGFPSLSKSPEGETAEALKIETKRGSSIGSWRTRTWLEQGRYRLEGRIKAQGIVADLGDPRGGAGFRVASSRPEKYLLGSSDWKQADYEFTIDDPLTEVQVICEFRGTEGQAWFDLQSLRLKKMSQ